MTISRNRRGATVDRSSMNLNTTSAPDGTRVQLGPDERIDWHDEPLPTEGLLLLLALSEADDLDLKNLRVALRAACEAGLDACDLVTEARYHRDCVSYALTAKRAGTRRGGPGQVYFIRATPTGLIKIGWSKYPQGRLKELQTAGGLPLELLCAHPGSIADERTLHRRFSSSRAEGEWFRPTADLLAHLRRLRGKDLAQ